MAGDSLNVQKQREKRVVVWAHFAHTEALATYMDRCVFES